MVLMGGLKPILPDFFQKPEIFETQKQAGGLLKTICLSSGEFVWYSGWYWQSPKSFTIYWNRKNI